MGIDVSPEQFIEKATEVNADIIASSTLMTSTMPFMRKIEEKRRERKLRHRIKTMIGGPPTDPKWAKTIGSDGWGKDAAEAVEKAKYLMKI